MSNSIDKNCPYIGNWECNMLSEGIAHVEFSLSQDGQLKIELLGETSIKIDEVSSVDMWLTVTDDGQWLLTSNGFSIDVDPSRLVINVDFRLNGNVENNKEELISELKEYIELQKVDLASVFLEALGKEMLVSEIDSTKMIMNGNSFVRIPDEKSLVIGRVEGDTGYLVENGYRGLFVVLEWCDWNCQQSIEDYSVEFERQREREKHILLLPVESVDNQNAFKDIVEITNQKGRLGLRIMDMTVDYDYYKSNIYSRYKNFKKNIKL